MAVPPGLPAGTGVWAGCPNCATQNQFSVPGLPASPGWKRPQPSGRQRALLVGINYLGSRAQLRGCINDVHNMRRLLTESFGWRPDAVRVLTDDTAGSMPTRQNIVGALRWLAEGTRPGDVLVFHYSGHGAQQPDPEGLEEDGMNETILPVDFQRAGMLTDDEVANIVVRPLPEGVRLTSVMDCCHSGTGLDLPFAWTPHGWREDVNPFYSVADVQLFSGCEDEQTSADVASRYGAPGGAMTMAFCEVLRANPCPTYPELLASLHKVMRARGFTQRPQLTSTQRFGFDRPFLINDIMPNSNPSSGRVFRRSFPSRPRMIEGPLGELLGVGMGVLGGVLLGEALGGLGGLGGLGALGGMLGF